MKSPGGLRNIWAIAYSPAGKLLAASTANGQVGIWDALTQELIGQPLKEHEGIIWDLAFSPDGQTLATAGADGKIILWDVDVFDYEATKEQQPIEDAIKRACSIVNSNFTEEEWTHFFGDEPYHLTCPEFPKPASPSFP